MHRGVPMRVLMRLHAHRENPKSAGPCPCTKWSALAGLHATLVAQTSLILHPGCSSRSEIETGDENRGPSLGALPHSS